jgi:hypothetical protein
MKPESEEYKMTKLDLVIRSFGIVIALVYVGLGILILWRSTELFPNLPTKYKLPAGSLLIVYGLFRGYRVYQKVFNDK